KMVPTDSVETFCTDGVHLSYSPCFVESGAILNPPGPLGPDEVEYILGPHELGHLFLGHHFRSNKEKDKSRANIAADLALYSLLKEMGIEPPTARMEEFMVTPGKFRLEEGHDMEWYLAKLVEQDEERKGKGRDDGNPSSGGNHSDEQGDATPAPP